MDLGIALPTSGPHASPSGILKIAQEAECLGYAAVWTYERLLYPLDNGSEPGRQPRFLPEHLRTAYEPIETLAYVAAKTSHIKLGTSVIGALFHVPVVLARRLATLDQFSEGRVIAGLGQGLIEQDFKAANVSLKRRGAGMEEFIAALRAAWGPDPVTFEGRFYHIPKSAINPKPVHQTGIPIILGAYAPQAIKRAAQVADGFNPIATSFESLEKTITFFRQAALMAGRDPSTLKVIVRANVPITAKPLADKRPYLGGSPEQIASDLQQAKDLNVDHVFFVNTTQPALDEQLRLLENLLKLAF